MYGYSWRYCGCQVHESAKIHIIKKRQRRVRAAGRQALALRRGDVPLSDLATQWQMRAECRPSGSLIANNVPEDSCWCQ